MTLAEQKRKIDDVLRVVVQSAIDVDMAPGRFMQELSEAWEDFKRRQAEREQDYLNEVKHE